MLKRTYIFIAIFFIAVSHTFAVTHRALLIGIGKYEDAAWGRIHGDNDVDVMVRMLRTVGFTDVVTLKNEKATKQGMVKAFEELAKRCRKGDVVYVHYSGHGQLMTDLDGDESMRHTARHAKWDESWVPYDAYMNYCQKDRGEKHLSDDEVAVLLTAIRKKVGAAGCITVVIDACHSGDATSGEEEECIRGVDTKFTIPRKPEMPPAKPAEEQWQTISACRPYQLCTELKGQNVGKLTYAISLMGRKLFSMDNGRLQQALQQFMDTHKGRLPQNPVVTGKK